MVDVRKMVLIEPKENLMSYQNGMSGQLMLPMGDHYPLAGNPRLLETESATLGTIMWVVTMTEATAVCLQLETEIALTHVGSETSFMVARIESAMTLLLMRGFVRITIGMDQTYAHHNTAKRLRRGSYNGNVRKLVACAMFNQVR